MTKLERTVADAFLVSRNATAAYLRANPQASYGTANGEGPDILSRDHVKAYLEIRWQKRGMSADEAIAHLVEMARGIPDEALNDDGTINPRKLKEFNLTGLVSGSSETAHGVSVKLYSRARALEKVLEIAGKIAPDSTRAALERLAAAIEGD